ncbi:Fic family protein [Flavobacterium hauense]
MEEIAKALELKNLLDSLRPIDKEQEARIMQKFRLDWNYHSNNLEGNSLTYGETKALLMFGITAQGKPLKDHSEIKGHNEAIDWVIEVVKGNRPLTESFIRELHRLLLNDLYDEKLKKGIKLEAYKTTSNHVITETGETFYFATPEETPAKMGDLMTWYNEKIEEENVNPILLAAEFHHKFIIIHPFEDGNGRTARILMNFILMKFGYPPVVIKTEDKVNYFAALRLADAGNITAFIEYIAKNLNRSLEIMIAGAQGESIEEPDDIDKEIALLEKRLIGLGEKSKKGKSEESLLEFYNDSFFRLSAKFIEESLKFERFYIDVDFTFFTAKDAMEEDYLGNYNKVRETNRYSDFTAVKIDIIYDLLEISISTEFINFNSIGFGEFKYYSGINFVFSDIGYSVYNTKQKIYEKPYGIGLTDSEIDKIIITEVKFHKDFIEQKIIEKESGK